MDTFNDPLLKVGCGLSDDEDSWTAGASAAGQAVAELDGAPLSCVLVFASVRFELAALLAGIASVVGDAPTIGATTAGEICDGVAHGAVAVTALASPHIAVRVGLGRRVSSDWEAAVAEAVGSDGVARYFGDSCGETWRELRREARSAYGLLFTPGDTRNTTPMGFEILHRLRQLSRDMLPICGASAGDDWHMERNYVLCGTEACPDSILMAVIETRLRVGMGVAHGLRPTERRARIGHCSGNTVHEIEGRPAHEAYSELLSAQVADLGETRATRSVKLASAILGGQGEFVPCVASRMPEGGGVRFALPVPEGATLVAMECDEEEMIQAAGWAASRAAFHGGVESPALALVFSCAVREHFLGVSAVAELESIARSVEGARVAGFLSFGEHGIFADGANRHGNILVSVMVFGNQLTPEAAVWFENQRLLAERSHLLAQSRVSEWRYRSTFEQAAVGIAHVTPDGRFLRVNQRFRELVGYTDEELTARRVSDITHPDDVSRDADLADRLVAGEITEYSVEKRYVTKPGGTGGVSLSAALLNDEDGSPDCLVGFVEDIPQR